MSFINAYNYEQARLKCKKTQNIRYIHGILDDCNGYWLSENEIYLENVEMDLSWVSFVYKMCLQIIRKKGAFNLQVIDFG